MQTHISENFWAKAEVFVELLLKYNQVHNITGARNKEAVIKNVEDSIYPLRFLSLEKIKKAIDVGTGAGFPGLLLALAMPSTHFVLFEPIAKKSAFLHLAKTVLGLENVRVSTNRVEKVEPFKVDLISSRAVTNTKMLIGLCKEFIDEKTVLLFYKGELVQKETVGLKNCEIYQREKRNYLIIKDVSLHAD